MIRFLAALLVAAFMLPAEDVRYFAGTGAVSLTATATALTIQQPTSNPKPVYFETATVYCSVACVVTQVQNGVAATATAGTARPITPNTYTASNARVFTASNVGAGTSIGGNLNIPAGGTFIIDLSRISLPNGPANTNYTIAVGAITGTAEISIFFKEK